MDTFIQAASMPPDGGQPAYPTSRAIAALKPAIGECGPPKGCIHPSGRGSLWALADYRKLHAARGLFGTSRRGKPYDKAKAESFMKTLNAEAVYLRDYKSFEDGTADLPRFLDEVYDRRMLHSALDYHRAARHEAGRD